MVEEKQPTQEAENLEENETQNEVGQTNEVDAEDESATEDVVKEEVQLDEYEEELALLRTKLEQKDEIISHKNRAIESLKRKSGANSTLEEIQLIKEEAKKEIDQMKQVVLMDIVEDEISKVSTSPSEKNLIKFHFDNSVKLADYSRESIREAIKTAKLKANEKKLLSKLEEMKEALKAKSTLSTQRESSSINVNEPGKKKYNEKELKILKAFGVKV